MTALRAATGPQTLRELHPAARLLPEMAPEEFARLKADIAAHGLHEQIVLIDTLILDGRHRERACLELGLVPSVRQWVEAIDGDPIAYVLGKNLHRRQLSPSQVAMVAADATELYEKEAAQRRRDAAITGNRSRKRTAPASADRRSPGAVPATKPERKRALARATDDAAKLAGASPRSTQRAKRIKDKAPQLAAKVRSGELTVDAAERELRKDAVAKERVLTDGALAATGRTGEAARLKLLRSYNDRLGAAHELSRFEPAPLAEALSAGQDAEAKWREFGAIAAAFAAFAERLQAARPAGLRLLGARDAQESAAVGV